MPRIALSAIVSLLLVLSGTEYAASQETGDTTTQYYRFSHILEGVIPTEDGLADDLAIDFFSDENGNVVGLNYGAFSRIPGADCVDSPNDEGELCIYCEGFRPICIGVGGPLSVDDLAGRFLLNIDPELMDDGDVNFGIELQNIQNNTISRFSIPGLVQSEDGALVPGVFDE